MCWWPTLKPLRGRCRSPPRRAGRIPDRDGLRPRGQRPRSGGGRPHFRGERPAGNQSDHRPRRRGRSGVNRRRGVAGCRRAARGTVLAGAADAGAAQDAPPCRTSSPPAGRRWPSACRPIRWRWPCCGPSALPLAAPSANRSTELSPTTAEHVVRGLGGRIDLILDGRPTTGGIESTVLDLTTDPPRILRPGLVTAADDRSSHRTNPSHVRIRAGGVSEGGEWISVANASGSVYRSPGMMAEALRTAGAARIGRR